MKTYAKAVDLVTTRDGKCPDGYVEVESPIANGGLSALLDHAFSVLESLGVPRTRAGSVSNGIMVLDQRHQRQHQGDQAAYSALVTEHERTERELALEQQHARQGWALFRKYRQLYAELKFPSMTGVLRAMTDGAPTLTDLADLETFGAGIEAVDAAISSDRARKP